MDPWVKTAAMVAIMAAGAASAADRSAFQYVSGQQTLSAKNWYIADYAMATPLFDSDFRADNVVAGPDLRLRLYANPGKGKRFLGAAIRRQSPSHFGLYEAVFKSASGPGVVTGFFLYTGRPYGTAHHEIDIEILGKDTRVLNVAWFVDGYLQDRQIPLGFDAAAGFHHYAFYWAPDRLVWFVDGSKIFEVAAKDAALPAIPGRLFANVWAAHADLASWAGRTNSNTRTEAVFKLLKFQPLRELEEPLETPYFDDAEGA